MEQVYESSKDDLYPNPKQNEYVVFEEKFNFDGSKATFTVCAEMDYVLYVNGHTHAEQTEYSFGHIGKVPTVTLPRGMGTDEYPAGIGIVIEVYESKVLVRARNFIEGEWIEDLAYTYDLK